MKIRGKKKNVSIDREAEREMEDVSTNVPLLFSFVLSKQLSTVLDVGILFFSYNARGRKLRCIYEIDLSPIFCFQPYGAHHKKCSYSLTLIPAADLVALNFGLNLKKIYNYK